MKKSLIYTKKGDQGETSLVDGLRVSKDHELVDLYGEVDELNSFLGVAISALDDCVKLKAEREFLLWIQHRLFDLGSNLACSPEKRASYKLALIGDEHIEKLEAEMDRMEEALSPLKNFVLPGGHLGASHLHVCRTVCRRTERGAVHLARLNQAAVPMDYVRFLNRLSDYFFVASRYVNKVENYGEVLWNAKL